MAETGPRGFNYTGDGFRITDDMKECFDDDGFIIIRGLLNNMELAKVRSLLETSDVISCHSYARDDGSGSKAGLVLWEQPGNDVTGMVARSHKVVNTMESLLGGEIYHYHTKLMLKDNNTPGAFLWHQDYGYWYESGCIYPEMGTVFIALDQAERSNGCLQVLRGSHRINRISHIPIGHQVAADPERVQLATVRHELCFLELAPGDAAFFHCNLLHCSGKNESGKRRWALLTAYNRASNSPMLEGKRPNPKYTPLKKVPNSAIAECNNPFAPEEKNMYSGSLKNAAFSAVKDSSNAASS